VKFWVWSDFHCLHDLHAWEDFTPPDDFDCALVAGDFGPSWLKSLQALDRFIAKHKISQPIFYVPGNHDFYGRDLQTECTAASDWLRGLPNGHPLQADYSDLAFGEDRLYGHMLRFRNYLIAGTALWTDFLLFGESTKARAMAVMPRLMNDFSAIRFSGGRFLPEHSIELHQRDLEFLRKASLLRNGRKLIFVTHHVPRLEFVAEEYKNEILSAAFTSDLSAFQADVKPDAWIFGHTHTSFDAVLQSGDNSCRFVCNPKGYRDENREFKPHTIVEL